MPMPKATMHKDDLTVSWQNDIGNAGKISTMQPESVAQAVQQSANRKLRLGVRLADERHALGQRQLSGHRSINLKGRPSKLLNVRAHWRNTGTARGRPRESRHDLE